jgi:cyanophycin synthetase
MSFYPDGKWAGLQVLCLDIDRVRALRGPNIWTRRTALEVDAVVGDPAPRARIYGGFDARMRDCFPALGPSWSTSATDNMAHVLERVALALQVAAGCPLSFSRTALGEQAGTYKVVVEYSQEEVGRQAVEGARQLIMAVVEERPFDVAEVVRRLRSQDENLRLGPTTGSIVRAAERRGIPTRRLNDGSLVQMGWGHKQRRILAAETDQTSAIAETIAQDKELTKDLLRAVGVPVPAGRPVKDAEDAWLAAQEVGLPVVVKPRAGNQGRGVAVNLKSREQVLAAHAAAREEGSSILVEKFAPGADYRLLVIGNKLVAAARREPPKVRGDGTRTIRELVDDVNQDPRRGEDHATSLSKISLDAIALGVLAEQGLTPDAVPGENVVVVLRRNANLSTGGSATDVTDEVHPDVAARAVDTARMIGLDICGVDVVCQDVRRPLEGQGGVIVEANAAPGLRMHLEPSYGKGRPVGEAIVGTLYGPGDDGRIPIVGVSGNNGKTTTVRLLAHIFRTQGKCVGMTCTDGVYVNDRRVDTGDCSGPKSARSVLLNPRVEAAVLETARGGILREGLGYDRCQVAIVTNIGEGDHLGMQGVSTSDQLAHVKRVLVENVAPGGFAVLNGADPHTVAMASSCPGGVAFFALDPGTPALAAHRAKGGRVLFVENGAIMASEGREQTRVLELESIPFTMGGLLGFQVENAMAAVGAAWSVGVAWDDVRQALRTFATDVKTAPGRFNVIRHGDATLVADYGHNADALLALVEALDHLPAKRRVIAITAAGDRRDVDIVRLGEIVGASFDEVILFEDACNRGRADGEVMGLLRRGVDKGGRTRQVEEVKGEFPAMELCIRHTGPGELGALMVDQVEEALDFIGKVLAAGPAGGAR